MARRSLRIALGVLVPVAALLGTAAPTVAAGRTSASIPALVRAINDVRARHGLPPVRESAGLTAAAAAHSRDMVVRGYFLHESGPGGERFDARVRRFWRPSPSVRVGEILAWGSGRYASPQAAIRMWLNSPPHRSVMLSRSFTQVGVGVHVGRFQGQRAAAVWTADFGRP